MKPFLAAALLLAAVPAQTRICVSGVVVTSGFTICQQGETHRLADTSVYLRSSTVNLNAFLGQNVRVDGTDIGLLCRVLDVTAATPAPATLELCGTPMPGCSIKFKVGPGAVGSYALAASFGSGILPLGCSPPDMLDGTWLLGSPAVTIVVAPFSGPFGEYTWPLPNNPSLQGVSLRFQGARQDTAPVGPAQFTNVLPVQLVPFMPPCGSINC